MASKEAEKTVRKLITDTDLKVVLPSLIEGEAEYQWRY